MLKFSQIEIQNNFEKMKDTFQKETGNQSRKSVCKIIDRLLILILLLYLV